jgi:hypothetical protein
MSPVGPPVAVGIKLTVSAHEQSVSVPVQIARKQTFVANQSMRQTHTVSDAT